MKPARRLAKPVAIVPFDLSSNALLAQAERLDGITAKGAWVPQECLSTYAEALRALVRERERETIS